MKILQINKFFYRRGGSETHYFELIDLLRKKGHQVIEFSMQDRRNEKSDYSKYFIKNIDFNQRQGIFKEIKKATHALYSFEAVNKLEQLIKKFRPDVAHLHNFAFQLSPSIIWVLKKYQIPIVWTMHDYKLICPNYRLYTQGAVCERCKKYRYYNSLLHQCLNNSIWASSLAAKEMYWHRLIFKSYNQIDLYLSPSQFLMDKCRQWGIEPKKIKLLRYFLNLKQFEPKYEKGDYLLYFGRLAKEKGVMDLLAAAKNLPAVKFIIAGIGPLENDIKKYIAKNKLGNVELAGFKKGRELQDLIRNSAAVLVPSVWHDNLPFAVFESQALGKIVIGSNLGGIPELIENNKTGYIFKAGDIDDLTIKIKLALGAESVTMGREARSVVEETFDQEDFYRELMEIYNRILNIKYKK